MFASVMLVRLSRKSWNLMKLKLMAKPIKVIYFPTNMYGYPDEIKDVVAQ